MQDARPAQPSLDELGTTPARWAETIDRLVDAGRLVELHDDPGTPARWTADQHDEIDAALMEARGRPLEQMEEEMLDRLVDDGHEVELRTDGRVTVVPVVDAIPPATRMHPDAERHYSDGFYERTGRRVVCASRAAVMEARRQGRGSIAPGEWPRSSSAAIVDFFTVIGGGLPPKIERHRQPDGRTTTSIAPRSRPPARQWTGVVNIHRQGRAARQSTNHRSSGSRRAGASSSSSSADPGDGDSDPEPPPPRPRLTLAPPPRGIYAYACLTAAERGAQVEAVVA